MAIGELQEITPNTPEWLEAKRSTIGASESPALFGFGYAGTSPTTVYESKVFGREPKFSDEQIERMNTGLDMEPALRNMFKRKTGIDLTVGSKFLVHPVHSFMSCTLDDGFVEDGVIIPVELKFISYFASSEWKGNVLPLKYQIQPSHQMAVTGAPYAYVFGMVDNKPELRKVERNEDFIDVLILRCKQIWKCVQDQTPPEPDGLDGTGQALGRIYNAMRNGETVELDEEVEEWSAKWQECDEEIKRLSAELKKKKDEQLPWENKIKNRIGNYEYGITPTGTEFRYNTVKRKGYTVEPTEYRTLSIMKGKKS